MLGYDRIFQSCQFLVLILVVVNEQHEDRCEIRGTVLKCLSMPSKIPNTVQEVFVLNCDLQNNILEFGSGQWENITLLDIKADKGKEFRDGHNPIFKGLTKLKTLGIHGKALNELYSGTFEGMPSLETLDLSYSVSLGFEWIKDILTLSSSLENLNSLDLTSIYSMFPVTWDTPLLNALSKRGVKSLNISGLAFEKLFVDINTYASLCKSIETLNMSDSIYTGGGVIFYESEKDNLTHQVPCLSIKRVDLSGMYVIDAALLWETDILIEMDINFKLFPSLEAIYANRIDFRAPEKSISFNGNHFKCSPCIFNNLKRVYLRGNHITWLNVTCDDCGNITLTHIDLSDNNMEYISPAFLRDWINLEEINLGDNELHVMEWDNEFEDLFATFQKLKRLILCKNKLKFIPKLLFYGNINLEHLDLSFNHLTTVAFSLKKLIKLKYLDLSQNKLSVLSAVDYHHLSQFLQKRLDYNMTFSLQLAGNSFSCTCDGYRFIYLIYVYVIPKPVKGQALTCETKSQHMEIDHEALYESRHHCNEGALAVTTTLLSFCLLVAVMSTGILLLVFIRRQYRHGTRQNFLAWFKNNRHVYKYFIHIIHCSKDDMFVQNHVVPVLTDVFEQVIGLEGDNLISMGFREYTLGRYIACEGDAYIRQSFSVLFMLTDHSSRCARCKSELQMAVNLNKPIAVLINETVDQELIPPWLQTCTVSAVTATFVRKGNILKLKPSKLRFIKAIVDRAATSVNDI